MDITLEHVDVIRERTGTSYRQAKELLEKYNGDIIAVLMELEEQNTEGKTWTEEFSVRSGEVVDKIKELIHEGNINRIIVKHADKVLLEIPVGLGAIGAVFLPQLAALGIMVAVFKRCTIEVVREQESDSVHE